MKIYRKKYEKNSKQTIVAVSFRKKLMQFKPNFVGIRQILDFPSRTKPTPFSQSAFPDCGNSRN